MKRIAIIQFPGTNCEYDCHHIVGTLFGLAHQVTAEILWHGERLKDFTTYHAIIVPGGFAHGDYLRAGAMARLSPIMADVTAFAQRGGYVAGICNGFQVLTEMNLLPGALVANRTLRFVAKTTPMRVERSDIAFTSAYRAGQVVKMPSSHGHGCFTCDEATLAQLNTHQQIIFRYCDEQGKTTASANPNGSLANIAGICNRSGNVIGLMPHPDRCAETLLGGNDGWGFFQGLIAAKPWQL